MARCKPILVCSLLISVYFFNALSHSPVQAQDLTNIFPLAPRELRQRLNRAQAAVDEQRFSDAVAEIGEVLNTAGTDDFFLGVPGNTDAQVSLKSEALALLGAMPLKGRRMFELQYGADAKVALEAALQSNDLTQLTEVSRRYFQTKAGYDATLILGRYQLDQGRPLAAALTLKRVADVPTAQTQYDPELSVMLAACWLHANQPEQAKQTLLALKSRIPQAKVRLVDREVSLFSRDAAALDWLQDIVGSSRSMFSLAATHWALFRGNEQRNAQSIGGTPLLNYNWKLPSVNDPVDEGRIRQQYSAIRDRDEPLVCALQPLVVQDYAIIRQPDSDKLVGISLNNGKRAWIYPWFDDSATDQQARQALQSNRNTTREQTLKQRIWDDNVFGQVSSDGRQVYVIDQLSLVTVNGMNVPNVAIGRGGIRLPNPSSTKDHNLLVALDLVKQGSLVWTVGGTIGDNPALAGAFFLGAPLPVGDQLFAIAEFAGEIRLVCLDSRTGNLEWKQPLATLENLHITSDPSRRLAAASPSLADGILICPTSAGAVVAMDLTTRTLRWGYQYNRSDGVQQIQRGAGFRQPFQPALTSIPSSKWLDSTATIADGCVVLTPPESSQLHCLDLLTGKARWTAIPRDEMLYVACVHKGKIILVGRKRLKAINLADGKPAWNSDLKLEGEVAVGRGYYSDSSYYLPLSGQQLCKIDLDNGTITSRTQTEVELGNLVCYQDQLISMAPQSVASFVLFSERLEKQLNDRLAANPNDAEALSIKAQVLLQEDKPDESLALLRRAVALSPDKPAMHMLLVKVMMILVRNDFAKHVPLTDELDKLITEPAQRREMLRYRVQGLTEQNRLDDAFAALLELADQELAQAATGTLSPALQQIDRERSVRLDHWLQGQLRQIMKKADSQTSARITAELKTRLDQATSAGGVHALRMFLNLFGFHEIASSARLTLIERLLAADALLEAEVVAGDLIDHADPVIAGTAHAQLAALYEKAKRPDLAARHYEQLARKFAAIAVRGSSTGSQISHAAKENATLASYFAAWPTGEIEIKENDTGPLNQRHAYPFPISHFNGASPRGIKVYFDPSRTELSVRSDTGQLLGSTPLGNLARRSSLPYGSVPQLSAKVNGHLVVVNLGSEIVAMDGMRPDRGNETLVWRHDPGEEPNNNAANASRPFQSNRNPLLGNNRTATFDSFGRQNLCTGPVTSSGVCYQRGRQIVCVEPLTGQTIWERSSTPQVEIPPQADLFGDDELLIVADARPDNKSDQALVFSAIDGQFLGRRKVDIAERRWTTHGRNVLAFEVQNSLVNLRLYDAWDSEKTLWARQVSKESKGFIIDAEELAVMEPNGQFTVVSLATGQVRFSVPLEAEPSLAWLQVIRSSSQYLVLASQENGPAGNDGRQPLQSSQNSQFRGGMHGRVYAFNRPTGKLQWQSPAFVSHHFLPPDQPAESPLLMFVANRQANNKRTTNLLALDRHTGRNVYEKEHQGQSVTCDLVVDTTKQNTLLALFGDTNRFITFQATDKPVAPEPPAQTGEMASSSANRPRGDVDASLGAALELLRRGPGFFLPAGPRPAPALPAVPAPAPPARPE
jgi:outer membrane protein assembly factor BamB